MVFNCAIACLVVRSVVVVDDDDAEWRVSMELLMGPLLCHGVGVVVEVQEEQDEGRCRWFESSACDRSGCEIRLRFFGLLATATTRKSSKERTTALVRCAGNGRCNDAQCAACMNRCRGQLGWLAAAMIAVMGRVEVGRYLCFGVCAGGFGGTHCVAMRIGCGFCMGDLAV